LIISSTALLVKLYDEILRIILISYKNIERLKMRLNETVSASRRREEYLPFQNESYDHKPSKQISDAVVIHVNGNERVFRCSKALLVNKAS